MKKRKEFVLLIILSLLLIIINYPFLDSALINFLENSEVIVERIVDGDTVIANNESIRLLGINCPEKGEKYYQEAKDFLNEILLNKKVVLEGSANDKYYRKLRYIFLNEKNVNIQIVENGLANVYILDDKKYERNLRDAWEECIAKNKNLCEKSKEKCSYCIKLEKLDCATQKIVFYNDCDFDCDLDNWTIKDEGRKKFIFQNFILHEKEKVQITAEEGLDDDYHLFWKGEDYVWTSTGDTLFLRDSEGKLVLWKSY